MVILCILSSAVLPVAKYSACSFEILGVYLKINATFSQMIFHQGEDSSFDVSLALGAGGGVFFLVSTQPMPKEDKKPSTEIATSIKNTLLMLLENDKRTPARASLPAGASFRTALALAPAATAAFSDTDGACLAISLTRLVVNTASATWTKIAAAKF